MPIFFMHYQATTIHFLWLVRQVCLLAIAYSNQTFILILFYV